MMKKVTIILTSIILIGVNLLSSTLTVQGAQDEGYAWVLVDVIDIDSSEEIADYNENYEGIYRQEGNYSRNNFKITKTYTGPSDDWYSPPKINGETASFTASYSAPPQVIHAGEEITINVSLSAVDNQSFFTFQAHVRPQFGKTGQSFGDFSNEKGEHSFTTEKKNNYASFNETMTAVAPGGSEGEILEIRFHLIEGYAKLETRYVYEWKMAGDAAPEIGEYTPPEPTPMPDIWNTDDDDCKDSGVRFSDMWGEVLVRPDDYILGWYAAELDMILCVMDHIKTSYDSEAVLSLSDLTTFYIREESHIVLDTESPAEDKIALLAGKIWVNLKKMLKDGSMNIEMSQAVAGIKGTTLVLEEDGSTSTLKVLEGTVELSSYAGESILVTDGQRVSVTDGTFGPVTNFSVEEEMEIWGATRTDDGLYAIENETYEENAVAQDKNPRTGIGLIVLLLGCAFLGFLIVAAVVIVFLVVKKKRKAN
ncbi:MAG: FecR family protein [Chloroflexota bacterium]|nr:FecR family protein [Chloroflexota bacterium]